MSDNTSVDLDKLTTPFPPQALKQRVVGGGKSLTYVEGHVVIHRLNDATGNHWDFKVLNISVTAAGMTAKGVPQSLYTATVELCIPGLGCRQQVGVQMFSENAGEDLVKGAVTDGLKKAATLFGVGLELYGPDYEAGEVRQAAAQAAPYRPPAPPIQGVATVNDGDAPSEKQLKMVWGIAKRLQMSESELHQFAGVASLNELNRQTIKPLIDKLVALQDAAAESAPEPSNGTGDIIDFSEAWKHLHAAGITPQNFEQRVGKHQREFQNPTALYQAGITAPVS